ncbi:MAG: hypothetical protein J6M02_00130 [Clostridia bacterium]|nr:hypothetical protein [Clostridia bacterium]
MSEMEFGLAATSLRFEEGNTIHFGQGKAIQLEGITPPVDIARLKAELAQAQSYEATLNVLKANGVDTKAFIEANTALMILTSPEGTQLMLNTNPDEKLTLNKTLSPEVALELQDAAARNSGISMKEIEEILVARGLMEEKRPDVVHTEEDRGFVHEDANMAPDSVFGVADKSQTEAVRDATQEEMYRRRQHEREHGMDGMDR